MTLLEVMVALAVVVGLVAVVGVGLGSMLQLEQRRVARQLVLTYQRLHDEAVLRNATFRLAYHLDDNYYEVEVGDPDTLIHATPEARERFEAEREAKLARFADEQAPSQGSFSTIATRFKEKIELPHGTRFGGVWTPQYPDLVQPGDGRRDEPLVVYSHLFASGYAEPTLVQIVDERSPDEGFTLVVEPLSGRVRLEGEVLTQRDVFSTIQPQAPELPN